MFLVLWLFLQPLIVVAATHWSWTKINMTKSTASVKEAFVNKTLFLSAVSLLISKTSVRRCKNSQRSVFVISSVAHHAARWVPAARRSREEAAAGRITTRFTCDKMS